MLARPSHSAAGDPAHDADRVYRDSMLCGTNDLQELSRTRDLVSRSKTELWHRVKAFRTPSRNHCSLTAVRKAFRKVSGVAK